MWNEMKPLQIMFKGEVLEVIDAIYAVVDVKDRAQVVRDAIYVYKKMLAVSRGEPVVMKQEDSTKGKLFKIPYRSSVLGSKK